MGSPRGESGRSRRAGALDGVVPGGRGRVPVGAYLHLEEGVAPEEALERGRAAGLQSGLEDATRRVMDAGP